MWKARFRLFLYPKIGLKLIMMGKALPSTPAPKRMNVHMLNGWLYKSYTRKLIGIKDINMQEVFGR